MKTDRISTIEIKGMKFHAKVGCLPREKEDGADLEVDFKGRINVRKAVREDDIALVPDVREICGIVEQEVGKPCDLLETLSDRIARAVDGAFPDFQAMKVTVRKLSPGLAGAEWWSATASINRDNENSSL